MSTPVDAEKWQEDGGGIRLHVIHLPLSGHLRPSLTSDLLLAPLSLIEAGSQQPTHLSWDPLTFWGTMQKNLCQSLFLPVLGGASKPGEGDGR